MNVGIDMVKIDRFVRLKDNSTFFNKVFCENEIKYLEKKNFNTSTIAGMFALKEAFLKALKKGLDLCPLNDIEICHDENGAPFIKLHNELKKLDVKEMSVSISHDGDYAISVLFLKLS